MSDLHVENVPLLVDADGLVYRCGFAVEKTKYLVEGPGEEIGHFESAKEAKAHAGTTATIWSRKEYQPVENAVEALNNSIKSIINKFFPKGDTYAGLFFLTGKGNFRDVIQYDRGYKENRDPAHRPKHYRSLRDYLVAKRAAKVVHGMEADDAIGLEAYGRKIDNYVIVSNDKDLDQLSGYHYDWTTDRLYFVNDEDALKFFYFQLLYGDPTDNVKGPLSEVKAKAAVEECRSPKECAIQAREVYKQVYGDEWMEMIDTIGELVWIRRENEVNNRGLHNPFWGHLDG